MKRKLLSTGTFARATALFTIVPIVVFLTLISSVPLFAASRLEVFRTELPNKLKIASNVETGRVYRLERKADLTSTGSWNTVTTVTSSLPRIELFTFPGPNEYYRLLKLQQLGGDISLVPGQVLNGIISIDVSSYSVSNQITSIELIDYFRGETNGFGEITGTNVSSARYIIDTKLLPNGPHSFQIKVINDAGGNTDADLALLDYSERVDVVIVNPVCYSSEKVLYQSWKLHVEFGTDEPAGSWLIDVYTDHGAHWGTASGSIATSTNSKGFVVIDDAVVDDGNGPRYRTYYDEYPGAYFDIRVTIIPPGGSPLAKNKAADAAGTNKIDWVRSRIAHRSGQRVNVVAEDGTLLRENASRFTMDAMMDAWYVGLGVLGPHYNLQQLVLNYNQQPQEDGWNKLNSPQMWTNLNAVIANSTNPPFSGLQPLAFLMTVTHGSPSGIGRVSAGIGGSVTTRTMGDMGFYGESNYIGIITGPPPFTGTIPIRDIFKRSGLTFCFLDGCDTMEGTLIHSLLNGDNHSGSRAHRSVQDYINKGDLPNYGRGWTRKKLFGTAFRNDVDTGHADYMGQFIRYLVQIDPFSGLPANTYGQTVNLARFWSSSPGTVNTASFGGDYVGSEGFYPDE